MQMLARNPAAAYRRVALEARIEASGGADLTRICLEECEAAIAQAHGAVVRGSSAGRDHLVRAQTIMLWLAKSVAPGHPLGASLKAFYGGLAAQAPRASCISASATGPCPSARRRSSAWMLPAPSQIEFTGISR